MTEYLVQLEQTHSRLKMSDFRSLAWGLLAPDKRQKPWQAIDHGIELLTDEQQLNAYVAAYGEMHEVKCRAAFQNFCFDELNRAFEVVDWGCGQGIATLTLCDMLDERNLLKLLQRVTLIEPSELALQRAVANVKRAQPNATVRGINKYLPSSKHLANEIHDIDCSMPIVIHLFSNILDIETIDLLELAQIICQTQRRAQCYVVCMGPCNRGAERIDVLSKLLQASDCFSDINQPQYAVTSDTHHSYGCKTKGFKLNATSPEAIPDSDLEATPDSSTSYRDDYDDSLLVDNGVLSEGAYKLYRKLSKMLEEKDAIFIKPNLNGETIDFVVLRPYKGVLVIKVCEDESLNGDNDKDPLHTETQCAATQKEEIANNKDNIDKEDPIQVAKLYSSNLIKLHIKNLFGKALIRKRLWYTVIAAVYYSKRPASSLVDEKDQYRNSSKDLVLIGCDEVGCNEAECDKKKEITWERLRLDAENDCFDSTVFDSFYDVLSPKWHSYKEGVKVEMTAAQRELVKSEAGAMRKINGVAGSGKTEVLATRAVNALLRTGRRVLILTFNITLVNYIKYRVGQVRADFSWSQLQVINYHQLISGTANSLGVKMRQSGSFEDVSLFEGVKEQTPRYAAIFIDEVQDYQSEWLKIVHDYFAEENAEFVVFGDAKQNIYNRRLDAQGQVSLGAIIGGLWNNSLNKGFRFNNALLAKLALQFQKRFIKSSVDEEIQCDAPSLLNGLGYCCIKSDTDAQTLVQNCLWIIHHFGSDVNDTVILAQNCLILRRIEQEFHKVIHNLPTSTTFETEDQFQPGCYRFSDDLYKFRRNKKLHFTMADNGLKLSTIQSFKGWEAGTVILILQPLRPREIDTFSSAAIVANMQTGGQRIAYETYESPCEAELIYTAITRAKQNLYILNMGNKEYDDFFKNAIAQC